MRLPRNVKGSQLVKLLKPLGYKMTRQLGSHMRLTTLQNGQHHITIPNHNPIRVVTLSAILGRIADHHQMEKSELLKQLFE